MINIQQQLVRFYKLNLEKPNHLQMNKTPGNKKQQSDFHYKIVLVGDSGVGKSNIISRFTKNQFNLESKTTIGVEFATKLIQIDGKSIKLQIWDTAGQQRYRSMASAYYRGANGALLVYDVTRASTLQNLDKWIKELKNYGAQDMVSLMIGNKTDLSQQRSVKFQHGEQFASKYEIGLVEGSALEGKGIEEAFMQMVKEMHSKALVMKKDLKNPGRSSLKKQALNIERDEKKEKSCCGK